MVGMEKSFTVTQPVSSFHSPVLEHSWERLSFLHGFLKKAQKDWDNPKSSWVEVAHH